ncbi:Fic family protein [Actinoplanes sp. NPDC049118]|uniref:Fic family protein n=1 Tax=Actinoplanes sp. NPDC049118 TaxID=3155769 RepID=UPI0033C4306C
MPDDLLDWWRVRRQVAWATAANPVAGPVGGHRDGFLDYVETTVAARDATRAARLRAALHQVSAAAAARERLDFDLLARWQAPVLGVPEVGFRTGAAYAKGGRERYGLEPGTRRRFEACLAEATDPLVPLPSRAARVYLDVAFVHPFPDGNARAALLCLYFVLRRDRVTIDLAAPVLTVVRRTGDLPGTLDMIRLMEVLIAATRRRAAAKPPDRNCSLR